MKILKTTISLAFITLVSLHANAQELPNKKLPVKKYWTSGMDGFILSTANVQQGGTSHLTTPRFSAWFHLDALYNIDFSPQFGLFFGGSVKNLGYIDIDDATKITTKRRVYTIGVPLGIKVGKVESNRYLLVGGGIDLPFHYKTKTLEEGRKNKVKDSEFFSKEVATIMPYVFVGWNAKYGVVKFQYYPTNMMNQDYKLNVSGGSVQPYKDYNVNLINLSYGFNLPLRPRY